MSQQSCHSVLMDVLQAFFHWELTRTTCHLLPPCLGLHGEDDLLLPAGRSSVGPAAVNPCTACVLSLCSLWITFFSRSHEHWSPICKDKMHDNWKQLFMCLSKFPLSSLSAQLGGSLAVHTPPPPLHPAGWVMSSTPLPLPFTQLGGSPVKATLNWKLLLYTRFPNLLRIENCMPTSHLQYQYTRTHVACTLSLCD